MEAERSPFSINMIELLVAIATAIVTWFGLRAILWSYLPVGYDLILRLPLSDFVVNGREEIFKTWILPILIILAISSIFFVRGIVNSNFRYFSRLSHFALAWPLLLYPAITYLYVFGLCCFPFGLILSFVPMVESIKSERKWWGGVFAVVWNVACLVVAGYYFRHLDYIFGD